MSFIHNNYCVWHHQLDVACVINARQTMTLSKIHINHCPFISSVTQHFKCEFVYKLPRTARRDRLSSFLSSFHGNVAILLLLLGSTSACLFMSPERNARKEIILIKERIIHAAADIYPLLQRLIGCIDSW